MQLCIECIYVCMMFLRVANVRVHIDRPTQFLKREEKFVTKDGEYGEKLQKVPGSTTSWGLVQGEKERVKEGRAKETDRK